MSFDATSRGGVGGGVGLGRPVRRACTDLKPAREAVAALQAELGPGPFSAVFVFASDDRDRSELGAALAGAFGDAPVVGAASPGEIGPDGLVAGTLTALALPRESFRVSWRLIEGADRIRRADGEALARTMMGDLTARGGSAAFGLMLSDADAAREEALAFAFGGVDPDMPFAGGAFGTVEGGSGFILADGRFMPKAAAAVYVAGPVEASVIRLEHLEPTETRMVITACDTDHRRVTELNGEAASAEYARLCDLNPNALGPAALADHPLLAAEGGALHGRTLRRVDPDGALVFAAAVEEGMILRLARVGDPAAQLQERLAAMRGSAGSDALIAFDDLARRRAAQTAQSAARVGELLAQAGAVGASTWGQQSNRMHCSGAFVGMALRQVGLQGAP